MKAVFFDLDQTLVDRDAAVRLWLAALTSPADCDKLVQIDAGGYGPRAEFFDAVAARTGCTAQEARARFRAELPLLVHCFPGVATLIERLSTNHVLGLISNGESGMQRAKLQHAGLGDAFDVVTISGEVGVAKPDARIFGCALERARVTADQTIFVGDHPVNDIAGARAAGLRTCWVKCPVEVPPESDHSIDRIDQLWELVA